MEGMTQCGQCLLCMYQFGIAGIMVLELALALMLMMWATNQMATIASLQGGDTSEGSLAHTINYNLGNNFVNCSYEDCCPSVLMKGDSSFTEPSQGIFTYNDTWPRATCVRPGDECTEEEEEQGLCDEELAPAPSSNTADHNCSSLDSNCTNAVSAPSSSDNPLAVTSPSDDNGNEDIVPLLPAEYSGRQQMCMLFKEVQNEENCWDLGLYDTRLREYFWAMLQPLSTVILVV